MSALNVVSLGASILCGVVTVIFIWNGLRHLYRGSGRGGREILYISLLSMLTGALIIWQLLDVVTQVSPH